DLKRLNTEELKNLAEEIRKIIIDTVSKNGGHLASNLGVVELTIALHYVFNSPHDRIIWDVGHQCYPHKLLTGRYPLFHTLRKFGGISGFPRIDESPHDAFGTGHSSTSISAALGMAEARDIKGESRKIIAVIGDGALTAGMAFEALNHAGHLKRDLIVILNDNEMSISKNVGALSEYLNRILTGNLYRKFKDETKQLIKSMPKQFSEPVAKLAEKAEETLKGILLPPGLIFEELGFEYLGPIDGHNIELLITTLKRLKEIKGPVLLHIITKKGKGYKYSEEDPCIFHGVGPFSPETGSPVKSSHKTYSELFGEYLTELASKDSRVIAITAAMKDGTGLTCFYEKYPERLYDVGIAEQHAVTFAAGLAREGLRPYVAIYSTFLQRAFDQIIHDVCIQKLPVTFCIDRAGIVGEDGQTHQGQFDLSYLRIIPNLIVMAPKDGPELKTMLDLSLRIDGPSAIRYPRGKAIVIEGERNFFSIGQAEILCDGDDIAILAVGNMVGPAMEAAMELKNMDINVTVVNARFIKPLDESLIYSLAGRIKRIITVEDNSLAGGFGSAVLEFLHRTGLHDVIVRSLGIPDIFVEHGTQQELRERYGLSKAGIINTALLLMEKTLIRDISL
ncbi:MAG: 1-deoxy-D-xylulose-5-phosphate synthase, partial [Thermodesulfovibrionales bacterium]|nr:1-deoxy-D-xylulose-5-phosphate synthase [Thermodesulfovibrionales bacterium]